MEERNSEGTKTWTVIALGAVASLAALGANLTDSGILSEWPLAVLIVGIFIAVAKAVGDYTASRPAKHLAMNQATALAAKTAAGGSSPPNP